MIIVGVLAKTQFIIGQLESEHDIHCASQTVYFGVL